MRLVSLCPSLTESIFRLGKGADLVGRTKFCVQPAGAVDAVERVGGTKNPKLDRIVELRPDIVFMNQEENRLEDAEALNKAGISVISTFVRDVPEAAAMLRQIGHALVADDAAETLAQAIEARAREMSRPRQTTSFVYLIWQKPLMATGRGTYIDALLTLAGGRNVVTGDRYPEIDNDVLRAADRILLSSEPFPFAERHRAELAQETNIDIERFQLVDGELLSWHGARTLEGLAYADLLFR